MKSAVSAAALTERLEAVLTRIAAAAEKSGRSAAEVTLVAVTKTVERAMIDQAYASGLRHFGENRVQDATRKFEQPLPVDAVLSMIGQLQSNKASIAVRLFHRIESVDRVSLIETLDRQAIKSGLAIPVLLQVNIAGEEQKAGCSADDVVHFARDISARAGLRLEGLMSIAPLVGDAEEVRPVFRGLRELRDRLQSCLPDTDLRTLSMGMTNDFEVAIEEGATEVRIGRAIFG
ncbi:MAG: YggS family pyridoxal phosphate-dependent enzyme [Thermomicrobiales bacterium]